MSQFVVVNSEPPNGVAGDAHIKGVTHKDIKSVLGSRHGFNISEAI